MAPEKRVRALNDSERQWVIDKVEDGQFWRLAWQRSKIWLKTVGWAAGGAVAFVNFGADFLDGLHKFLTALGLK